MRYTRAVFPAFLLVLAAAGCKSNRSEAGQQERERLLASAIASTPLPSKVKSPAESIGHAANVVPGVGPKRVETGRPRVGPSFPILPGEGIGPIRFGANQGTIERLMGKPCEEVTPTSCRYIERAVEFELEGGVTKAIKIHRKGRAAKTAPDGSILEYGFFNGVILPDVYFGMLPEAVQAVVGAPQKVETITPMGADGFAERHVHDGMTLEYDRWSNGKLVLGAVILTKSETAAAANAKAQAERDKKYAELAKSKPAPPRKNERPR